MRREGMQQVLRPRGGSVNHQSSHLTMYLVEYAGRMRRERRILPRSSNLDPDGAVSFRCSVLDFRQGCRRRSVLSPRDETKAV